MGYRHYKEKKRLKRNIIISIFGLLMVSSVLFGGYKCATAPHKFAEADSSSSDIVQPDTSLPITKSYDSDSMTSYAVVIGRAAGCGCNTTPAMKRIGQWFDTNFAGKPEEKSTQLLVFMTGVEYHANMQHRGESPDTCAQVKKAYNKARWP